MYIENMIEFYEIILTQGALQQLREMGITDENVARQALAATGGDIQAAIDLIFGDGLM